MSTIFILTGAPGVGKTAIFREINDAFHPDWLHREPEHYNGSESNWIEHRYNVSRSHQLDILFDRYLESSWTYATELSDKIGSITRFQEIARTRNVVFINVTLNEQNRTSNIQNRTDEHKRLFPFEICESSDWFTQSLHTFLKRVQTCFTLHNVHIVNCCNSLNIPIRVVANDVLAYIVSAQRSLLNYEMCDRESSISLTQLLHPIRILNTYESIRDEMLSGLNGSDEELYRRNEQNE